MYAVLETGGQQVKVAEGDLVKVQKLEGAAKDQVVLDKIMLVSIDGKVTVGHPYLANAKITAEIVGQGRHPKVIVFKKRRRVGYKVKRGHRQQFTQLKIVKIEA